MSYKSANIVACYCGLGMLLVACGGLIGQQGVNAPVEEEEPAAVVTKSKTEYPIGMRVEGDVDVYVHENVCNTHMEGWPMTDYIVFFEDGHASESVYFFWHPQHDLSQIELHDEPAGGDVERMKISGNLETLFGPMPAWRELTLDDSLTGGNQEFAQRLRDEWRDYLEIEVNCYSE